MNKFFEPTYEDNGGKVWGISELLDLVKDWEDPNPKVVIEEYDGIKVVRDDLLHHGSKIRFIDKFIKDNRLLFVNFNSGMISWPEAHAAILNFLEENKNPKD